jgi:hypothetical protein
MIICDVLDHANIEFISLGVFGMTHRRGVSSFASGAIHTYQWIIFIADLT